MPWHEVKQPIEFLFGFWILRYSFWLVKSSKLSRLQNSSSYIVRASYLPWHAAKKPIEFLFGSKGLSKFDFYDIVGVFYILGFLRFMFVLHFLFWVNFFDLFYIFWLIVYFFLTDCLFFRLIVYLFDLFCYFFVLFCICIVKNSCPVNGFFFFFLI